MIRTVRLALALLAWAGPALAQVTSDDGPQQVASGAPVAHEPARVRGLALDALLRSPDDVAALLALGRAELALGDPAAALVAARRAHAVAPDDRARYTAARIAAKAHADLGQLTRAQVWLRRAAEDAPDAQTASQVARDYRAVRDANPLSVSLTFGLAPTSNVNGGSTERTFVLPGFPEFVFDGEARALSGLRLSLGGALAYRLAEAERRATSVEVQASGRTYALSDDAREQVPDVEGSDFSDVTVTASLVHRWRGEEASGSSSASLTFGRAFYGGDSFLSFARVSTTRAFLVSPRDLIDAAALVEQTWRLEEDEAYLSLGARLGWTRGVGEAGDLLRLSLGLRDTLSDLRDVAYDGVTAGAGYEWGRPVLGMRVGIGVEAERRRYDVAAFTLDGRDDRTLRLRASFGLPRVEFYGFYPTLEVEASRTESNVSRYTTDDVTLDLGFRSSF
jgi:tetratricopeptide (TPR) repeat protein